MTIQSVIITIYFVILSLLKVKCKQKKRLGHAKELLYAIFFLCYILFLVVYCIMLSIIADKNECIKLAVKRTYSKKRSLFRNIHVLREICKVLSQKQCFHIKEGSTYMGHFLICYFKALSNASRFFLIKLK